MSAMGRRVAKLEGANQGAGRVIVFRVPPQHAPDEVRAHLARHGIVEQASDLVVMLGDPAGSGQGWSAPRVTMQAGAR